MPKKPATPTALHVDQFRPMLLGTPKAAPANEENFLSEIKYDGYRVLCQYGAGPVQLRSKSGADCGKWFPEITRSLADIEGGPHIIDGEMVVQTPDGGNDFDALHERARRRRWNPGDPPVVYAVFDILVLAGRDVTQLPVEERKELLRELFTPPPPSLLFVDYLPGAVKALFLWAAERELEGVVAKRLGSVYSPGERSPHWLKLKRKMSYYGFSRKPRPKPSGNT